MPELTWTPHKGQRDAHLSNARFKVLACGRRWGKSLFALMELLISALNIQGMFWWVSSYYKLLIPVSNLIREWVPDEFIARRLETANVIRYLELANGSKIFFHSADREDSLRGSGLDGLVIDEAASMKESRWFEELRPSLMDKEGWAIAIGTPKGKNWFYRLYLRGQDPDSHPDWMSWRMPTSINPHISSEEIAAAKNSLPEITYRQEVLAEFLEGEGTVFRKVDEAISGLSGGPESGRSYFVGVDLARLQDFSVLVALDDSGHVRAMDRFRHLDWAFQKERIKRFADAYNALVIMDTSGLGDPIFNELSRSGLRIRPFKFTSESKKQLIENLSIRFDNGTITIPEDQPQLLNELKAYTYEILPSGRVRYGAPEGLYDDCVIGLALAAWGLKIRRKGFFMSVRSFNPNTIR